MLRRLAALFPIASPAEALGVVLMTLLLVLWATLLSMNRSGGNQDASLESPSPIARTAAINPQEPANRDGATRRFEDDARVGHRTWPGPSTLDAESEPADTAVKPDSPSAIDDPLMA